MSHVFLLALEKGVPFRDGAMAALLHDRGVPPACPEAINLESPDLVAAMHSESSEAGAEIIEISTFGATGFPLNRHGLAGGVRGASRHSVKIAQRGLLPTEVSCVVSQASSLC